LPKVFDRSGVPQAGSPSRCRKFKIFDSGPRGKILPGAYLKQLREWLGLTVRQVEQLTRLIANAKGSKDYFISHGWLSKLESEKSLPGIYTLFSLSVIYRIPYPALLSRYGIHLETIEDYYQLVKLPHTHLASEVSSDLDAPVTSLDLLNPDSLPAESGFLSSLIDESGQISVALLKQLGIQLSRYGYIGMKDYRMFPILRPGSLIMIDQLQNKVIAGEWLPEYDRPIYFLEMREGFTCSWCKLDGQILTLMPHPVSSYPIEDFLYPRDIEIVGRVVSVFLRLDNPVGTALPPAHDPSIKRSG
jgi:transcriptional regulator with XRE-family HTH domain